jgi:hypothetical protein
MTDTENREQKKELLMEYIEAEAELAALNEKRNRMVSALELLARYAKLHMQIVGPNETTGDIRDPIVLDPAKHPPVTVEEVLEISRQIRAATQRLSDLRERKKSLGLP